MKYKYTTPKTICNYINFNAEDKHWDYLPQDVETMFRTQAKGAAKIWNLLIDHQIALLADEVGMGKTIQALAVIATLLREKPDANILVYVPNKIIANKWVREYDNFIRAHYRTIDGVLKVDDESAPLKGACTCENQADLLLKLRNGCHSIYVAKISSLSHLGSIDKSHAYDLGLKPICNGDWDQLGTEGVDWQEEVGLASNRYLREIMGEFPFDLMVIDEAHYFRTVNRFSNRTISAKTFIEGKDVSGNIGRGTGSLAPMKLLMTATPNHSAAEDVRQVVSFFKQELRAHTPEEILKLLCVRRFRRLQGKTKHEYRNEIAEPVALNTISEKLFFAGYQKSLVFSQSKERSPEGNHKQPYSVLFGYLEGFEFISKQNTKDKSEQKEDTDFETAQDHLVLTEMVDNFYKSYHKHPDHPKYGRLCDQLSPKGHDNVNVEKALVFVRRIPSVFEISRRVMNQYDQWLIEMMCANLPVDLLAKFKRYRRIEHWPRMRGFFHRENSGLDEKELDEFPENFGDDEQHHHIQHSVILDLFTVKRSGRNRSTDCSNFKNRLLKRNSVFSLFFQPCSDYSDGSYKLFYEVQKDDIKGRDYLGMVRTERFANLPNPEKAKLCAHFQVNSDAKKITSVIKKEPLMTLLGLYWTSEGRDKELFDTAKRIYQEWNADEKEAFSNYLQKGLLQASHHIVHFYSLFKSITGQSKSISVYRKFCKKVYREINRYGLHHLISENIISFRNFYKKEMNVTSSVLLSENWNFFNTATPIYPYCGATKRPAMVKAFNTPFFPNVLVATSVLQEGVDLHYHCSRVIHYGMAWTPGDNEQRIGRVDRLMGQLDSAIANKKEGAYLNIHHPFLERTLDEDQMGRFIIRKFKAENLVDHLKDIEFSKELNLIENPDRREWMRYFRKPVSGAVLQEPFGVSDADFEGLD